MDTYKWCTVSYVHRIGTLTKNGGKFLQKKLLYLLILASKVVFLRKLTVGIRRRSYFYCWMCLLLYQRRIIIILTLYYRYVYMLIFTEFELLREYLSELAV
jgi:hypothetical protein